MTAPSQPPTKARLSTVSRRQTRLARQTPGGCSARALFDSGSGGPVHRVWCLRAGIVVGVAAWGPARCSVQVLAGSVCVRAGRTRLYGWPGDLVLLGDASELVPLADDTVLLVTSLPA